ncbi:hypothetical protein AB5J55_43895 [Streptomyces sp. R11]|uniref:Uncharacterized protein n=1 Tax=Streptomyces sp. R11 TaxID=3238625 RepID=A0AB39NDK0_9ACTN
MWLTTPVPGDHQVLADVATGQRGSAWAVGFDQDDPNSDYYGPAAYTYQDAGWKPVTAGLPINTRLDGVDTSDAGVFSVGEEMRYQPDGQPGYHHLAVRWDGSTWHKERVPQPSGADFYSRLVAVDALSSGEAWAVGNSSSYTDDTDRRGVLMHRAASGRWEQIKDPAITAAGDLNAVLALSRRNIWAVGQKAGSYDQPSILRYDGHTWSKADLPELPGDLAILESIAGTPHNLWAVGYTYTQGSGEQPLALHYDGHTWKRVPTPGDSARLTGVTVSGDRAYAVGYATPDTADINLTIGKPTPPGRSKTTSASQPGQISFYGLILTPAGSQPMDTPPQSGSGTLSGIDTDHCGRLWTVGNEDDKDGNNLPYAAHTDASNKR